MSQTESHAAINTHTLSKKWIGTRWGPPTPKPPHSRALLGLSEQPPRIVTPRDARFPRVQAPRVYGSLACLISQCCRHRVERTAARVIDQPPRWVAHSSHMPMGTADRTCPNQHAKTQAQGPGSQAKTPKAHPGRMHRCGGSPLLAAFPGRARFRATPRRLPGSRA